MTTAEFGAADFTDFFTALWGKPPFAWQRDLARRVLERGAAPADSPDAERSGPWPEAIALPTASGKTACMDIAVFALASQASRLESGRPVTAPRRIFFVVDRRVIVDEAYDRARRLTEKLGKAHEGILKSAADNLRRIARGESAGFADERPLSVHVLRGGMYRSEAWARSPLQPTITASTVDQIGSRLLFRAYGRGSGTWPVYAGLAANDSLILLDEAHCAQPFLQTLQAVRRFRTWAGAEAPPGRCFHPVVMSATPPPGLQDVFKDRSDEGRDPGSPLGRRRLARKPAILREIAKAKGNRAADVLAESLAKAAVDLLDGQRCAVAVFVNRVAAARKTWRRLRERENIETVLLTGRMRPIDKDEVVDRLKPLQAGLSEKRALPKPLVVVATQTLEVGADLDFDGLVTECASLDALRQRFGRLNRMGRPIEARAAILIRGDQAGEKADDPIYGKALAKTWNWLNECKDNNGEVDFGIARFELLLPQGEDLAKLNMPARNAPVMLPAHVDCWAQTSPEPSPSPDVAPFLHGEGEGAPDVQVCWRADLDLANEPNAALDILRLCPPSSSETLPVPVSAFRRWLTGEDAEDDSGDVQGAVTDNAADSRVSPAAEQRRIVRWRGADTKREDITADPADIRPGDVIVIPTDHPGRWERLGDLPPDAVEQVEALDAGDRAYRLARAKRILRLHPNLLKAWPDSAAKKSAGDLLRDIGRKYEEDPDETAEAVRGLLGELAEQAEPLPERWLRLRETAAKLEREFAGPERLRPDIRVIGKEGNESLVLVGRRRIAELAGEADSFSDEDDAAASGIARRNGRPVRLNMHLRGVEEFARRYALGCGLPHDLAEAVACAGLLHDTGKADPRFQSLLQGGARWLGGEPLAKSAAMPKTRSAYDRARKAAGYPEGGRHELLSLRLAESAPQLLPESDDLRDLTLHLIAAHHGRCRPFAPVICDGGNETKFALPGGRMCWSGPTGLERLDSGAAERYWRLTRRYGWWGLAWLEALLRLADWRRSEWEETHDDGA